MDDKFDYFIEQTNKRFDQTDTQNNVRFDRIEDKIDKLIMFRSVLIGGALAAGAIAGFVADALTYVFKAKIGG